MWRNEMRNLARKGLIWNLLEHNNEFGTEYDYIKIFEIIVSDGDLCSALSFQL